MKFKRKGKTMNSGQHQKKGGMNILYMAKVLCKSIQIKRRVVQKRERETIGEIEIDEISEENEIGEVNKCERNDQKK